MCIYIYTHTPVCVAVRLHDACIYVYTLPQQQVLLAATEFTYTDRQIDG